MLKLADNVNDFLARTAEVVGKFRAEEWRHEMHNNMIEFPITSPIEQLFYAAMNAMAIAKYLEFNPEPIYIDGTVRGGIGLHCASQIKIGKYRADFVVVDNKRDGEGPGVIVELDGHDFHDRDKQQRSYEKARDRFFVKEGYRIAHFTGSDVVKDPFAVAYEVLELAEVISPKFDPYIPGELFST